jgi:glutamate synthase (NADPH) small chain
LRESERCLLCPDEPCISGCPVGINIPGFIEKIGERNFRGAYDILTETNLLPSICGRVCPQENQCEGVCTVGESLESVAIGRLERFVGDTAIREGWVNIPYIEPNRFRIGIVGSGPAGMACAADMAKAGCDVTVYEAFHQPGGVLRYGIPDFRLPNAVIDAEISNLKKLGVRFECNTLVGRLFTIEQMIDEMGFHAVFVGVGAGYPTMLNIPGDSLNGVLSANELLTRCNLMRARDFPAFDTPLPIGKRVAVVGAGNTAMDAMRVSIRLGAEKVYCIYRRSRTEAPARAEEVHHAEEEGIEFHWLTNPVSVLDDGNGNVRGLRCVRMELGEPDDSGRRRPVPVAGSEFDFEADLVVYAIGTNANPIMGQTSKLKLNKWGYIGTDDSLATSVAGVFAGGDIVTGAATVIEAMGAGRRAAASMKDYLGIRDPAQPYIRGDEGAASTLFGIDTRERNFARVRIA